MLPTALSMDPWASYVSDKHPSLREVVVLQGMEAPLLAFCEMLCRYMGSGLLCSLPPCEILFTAFKLLSHQHLIGRNLPLSLIKALYISDLNSLSALPVLAFDLILLLAKYPLIFPAEVSRICFFFLTWSYSCLPCFSENRSNRDPCYIGSKYGPERQVTQNVSQLPLASISIGTCVSVYSVSPLWLSIPFTRDAVDSGLHAYVPDKVIWYSEHSKCCYACPIPVTVIPVRFSESHRMCPNLEKSL